MPFILIGIGSHALKHAEAGTAFYYSLCGDRSIDLAGDAMDTANYQGKMSLLCCINILLTFTL